MEVVYINGKMNLKSYCPDDLSKIQLLFSRLPAKLDSLVNNVDLFMLLREEVKIISDSRALFEILKSKMVLELNEENEALLLAFCQMFCSKIKSKWCAANRTLSKFLKKNEDWLESPITWPISLFRREEPNLILTEQREEEETENLTPNPSCSNTPRKPFEQLCPQQKRRRLEQLNKSFSSAELLGATTRNLKENGQEELAQIVSHLLKHPEHIPDVKACIERKQRITQFVPEKALGLIVSLKLTKWQYLSLRDNIREEVLFPSYNWIQEAKQDCYPPKDSIILSEEGAEVKLQALLDNTVSRLVTGHNLQLESDSDLELISKWGFDGASGQSNYKQVGNVDDTSIFMASLVPLKLMSKGSVVWENKRPSSTAYCRPILFKFIKETKESVDNIKRYIDGQIAALIPTQVGNILIRHQLLLTMIDGKICSYISETSTSVCDICKAKPSEMNTLNVIKQKTSNPDLYQYGLSSLHAWIRCMECLLHIAYRLDIKKWRAQGEDKEKVSARKTSIQAAFKAECGLIIDVVKQGAGTTNDGNTARRFFGDSNSSARITGVNEDLIERFHIILQTIACGESVEVSKFSEFFQETAVQYVELYPWYYMPASMHKLLIHGADIIEHFGLMPIGKLSEEAAEARNKDFRVYRERHSRKTNRTATNEDIIHSLLLSSDPQLSHARPRMKKMRAALSLQAKELLVPLPRDPNEIEFVDVQQDDLIL